MEIDFTFSRVIHLTDSSIVYQQIQNESYGFATFVATWIGEIQSKTDPVEWWWIPSEKNVADRFTETDREPEWKNGPEIRKEQIELWPMRNDNISEVKDLPDRIGVILLSDVTVQKVVPENPDLHDIQIKRYSCVYKLYCITSIIMLIAQFRSFKGVMHKISVSTIEIAELEWSRFSQLELPRDWKFRFR